MTPDTCECMSVLGNIRLWVGQYVIMGRRTDQSWSFKKKEKALSCCSNHSVWIWKRRSDNCWYEWAVQCRLAAQIFFPWFDQSCLGYHSLWCTWSHLPPATLWSHSHHSCVFPFYKCNPFLLFWDRSLSVGWFMPVPLCVWRRPVNVHAKFCSGLAVGAILCYVNLEIKFWCCQSGCWGKGPLSYICHCWVLSKVCALTACNLMFDLCLIFSSACISCCYSWKYNLVK